ncbi:hypothetical protein DBT46_005790, partial [Aerococcus mictus]|uniref:hypothetical protein n=1 Tax=Aerococcus mictus TaxID=2976810 RepID=UPI002FCF6747
CGHRARVDASKRSCRCESDNQEQRRKGNQGDVVTGPINAQALACPENAEGRQHDADTEFQGVLGDLRQRFVNGDTNCQDGGARRLRCRARE